MPRNISPEHAAARRRAAEELRELTNELGLAFRSWGQETQETIDVWEESEYASQTEPESEPAGDGH